MAEVGDKDVAIWVCPEGSSPPDALEFYVGSPEPRDKVCGMHGLPFHKRCPRKDCPDPTYHPSDIDRNFHHCSEPIPWSEARSGNFEASWDYEPFNSTLVGRRRPDPPAKGVISSLLDQAFADTRIKRKEPTVPEVATATRPARGFTWNEIEDPDTVGAFRERFGRPQAATRRWWHGLSGPARWLVGVLGATIAGVLSLVAWNWMVAAGWFRLQ